MNIAFFLTPKKDIVYENSTATMRQVLERIERSRYTAIPLVDNDGKYTGVITEGDLLLQFKNNPKLTLKDTDYLNIEKIDRRTNCIPVSIEAKIEDLITLAKNQNFVPVVDDEGVFIGIIKRSDIINYCWDVINKGRQN